MNEDELIERLRSELPATSRWVELGIGDDAAVMTPPAGEKLLFSADALVENVHFDRDATSPREWGRKSFLAAASDIAAMGGRLHAVLLSIGIGLEESTDSLWESIQGFMEACELLSVDLIGGNLSRASATSFHVTVIGASVGGRFLTRSGARIGDGLFVSGELGLSAAGLHFLQQGARLEVAGAFRIPRSLRRLDEAILARAYRAHTRPSPRLALGRWLNESSIATSCMDLSDGLSRDVHRLCSASGVGAEIDEGLLPVAPELRHYDVERADRWALEGGEDYELMFTADLETLPTKPDGLGDAAKEHSFTRIGKIVEASKGIRLVRSGLEPRILEASGWDHFDQG